jgi:hypothetical protein
MQVDRKLVVRIGISTGCLLEATRISVIIPFINHNAITQQNMELIFLRVLFLCEIEGKIRDEGEDQRNTYFRPSVVDSRAETDQGRGLRRCWRVGVGR